MMTSKKFNTKLTRKQRMFVSEYLVDMNATQAAIRAGYSPKTANEQGARLLANVSVANAIKIETDQRAEKNNLSAQYVIEGIIGLIKRAEKNGQESTALRGYELLGKHLGMFKERLHAEVQQTKDNKEAISLSDEELEEIAATGICYRPAKTK